MRKLKGLLLTEGMHGMISQVEGLAKALELDFIHEKIELNNFWKLLPPSITPVKNFVFKNNIKNKFDIVISCGRKSVIPSIYLKNKFKNKIMNIHIQDPKVSLDNFDYIIAPEHDSLKGKNVLTSKGAIHYLTDKELNENENYLKSRVDNKKKIAAFIIGGPNKYYNYTDKTIEDIFFKMQNNFINNNYQLIIIPSMRTPKYIIQKAKNYFAKGQVIIEDVDKKAYLSALMLSKIIVVTCDSTSMISEAAITGKPIYIAQMPATKNNDRFKSFFKLFDSLNITKDLDTVIENWNYQKLDEANKISIYIKNKLNNYDFS
ncbi:mitochondrial fission ELM1 family protein [Candidatus Pelagibacter sp.]|nr:mitochondrial fission ELM1 family protein [Candidatus Pelagibacter sp.]